MRAKQGDIMDAYPEVFRGVGKLTGVSFHVDQSVRPVAQPVRRLPLGFRGKVKFKIDDFPG